MKRTRISRDPIEFNELCRRWKADSEKAGKPMSMVQIKRTLANNMKRFSFKPGQGYFKEDDLW